MHMRIKSTRIRKKIQLPYNRNSLLVLPHKLCDVARIVKVDDCPVQQVVVARLAGLRSRDPLVPQENVLNAAIRGGHFKHFAALRTGHVVVGGVRVVLLGRVTAYVAAGNVRAQGAGGCVDL